MSVTRSRSEIESALTDKQALRKPKISSDSSNEFADDFELEARNPRRQQVIGGALTGVSGRYSKSILNRISEMHITNWLAVGIVACILVAFFWPDNRDSVAEVTEQRLQSSIEPINTDLDVEEPLAEQAALSFSREDDVERANQFRIEEELKSQVEALLKQAREHVQRGEYTAPNNANALVLYRQMLELDSGNSDAIKGITELKNRFLDLGQLALIENNESNARTALTGLQRIDIESEEYATLTNSIEQWRIDKQVDELLNKASVAKSENNRILPANNSSLHFYQEVLKLDENNQSAINGIDDIADFYIDQANAAVIAGDLNAATGYLATASVVKDDHPSINVIRDMITNAEPIAAQREVNRAPETITKPTNQNSINTATENLGIEPSPITPLPNRQISDNRTPQQQASEQAAFDEIYLNQGLDAYYQGDYTTAAALLQPLADKGVSRAQFRIGYMYFLGRGFEQNQIEADRILRAALPAIQKFANEGRSWAQSDLGSLYEDGLVLPRDYAEAVYWYRSAAEQGYPGAQTNLGNMYARGQGVSRSRQTAIDWFQRAAQQGDIAAIRNLESLGVN